MNGCNCCQSPPCPPPFLVCESKSASGTKLPTPTHCGFLHDGKRYLTRTITTSGSRNESITQDLGFGGFTATSTSDCSFSETDVTTISATAPCTSTTTRSGFSNFSGSLSYNPGYPGSPYTLPFTESCSATRANDGSWSGSRTFTDENGSFTEDRTTACCNHPTGTTTTTYSNENPPPVGETTAEMISRIINLLPSTPNGSSCSSFRNLSPTESSYTVRRTSFKVKHLPTGTCYLKVWIQTRFTPESGSVVITPLATYEWNGSGNPCLPSPSTPADDDSQYIESSATEISEPGTDGTRLVEIQKWSCVPGYTPPDDGSANGFPPTA